MKIAITCSCSAQMVRLPATETSRLLDTEYRRMNYRKLSAEGAAWSNFALNKFPCLSDFSRQHNTHDFTVNYIKHFSWWLGIRDFFVDALYKSTFTMGSQLAISITITTRGQSNLTKSASRRAHSPVRGHSRGSKVVPLNSWGRISY